MAIEKLRVERVDEMTEPDAWPDLDEEALRFRAQELLATRNEVGWTVAAWRQQQMHIFGAGGWSGSGADAGGASIQSRIGAMENLAAHLGKSFAYYNWLAQLVTQAKTAINASLGAAEGEFARIRATSNIDHQSQIDSEVRERYKQHSTLLKGMSGQVPAFDAWAPPPNSIPSIRPTQPRGAPRSDSLPSPTIHGFTRSAAEMTAPLTSVAPVAPAVHAVEPQPAAAPPIAPPSGPPDGSLTTSSPSAGVGHPTSPGSGLAPTGPSALNGPSPNAGSSTSSSAPTSSNTTTSATSSSSADVPHAGSGIVQGKPSAPETSTSKSSRLQPLSAQAPAQLASSTPATSPSPAPTPTSQSAAPTASTSGSTQGASGASPGAAPSGTAPVGAAPAGGSTAAAPPVPLGPPTTPVPAAPPPAGTAPAAAGPGVGPMSAASASGAAAAPAPVPVSTARAERDAILAASTPGGRKTGGGDPLQRARHIGAALNVGVMDFGFFWVTGLTADGTIVVANSYGLAYIPDGIHLPEHVKMATADESISPAERATWATYPILAVQGWCRHHDKQLRAVVATEEQFANFDPGVAKIILTTEDIPDDGTMNGHSRLEVIAPDAAQRLTSIADTGLTELLPPAATDLEPPADQSAKLWFDVAKPLMSTSPQRGAAHLHAFVAYADHAQELALHRAQTASESDAQRHAITDWIYWQHLGVLMNDAVASEAPA